MSLPEIQYQLTGKPSLLAGRTGAFLNSRPISYVLAGTVAARALSSETDALLKMSISLNSELSMSTSRDAFLGHVCVSPAGVEDHSTPDGSDDVQNLFAGSANDHG